MKASHREITKALPTGYHLDTHGRGGHLSVVCPDGTRLRGPDGVPVLVVNTPSDPYSIAKSIARIRRALAHLPEGAT